jgi:hypothetical protein
VEALNKFREYMISVKGYANAVLRGRLVKKPPVEFILIK